MQYLFRKEDNVGYIDLKDRDLPEEIWKSVPEYGDRYVASNKGRIKVIKGSRSGRRKKVLDTYAAKNGYETVKIYVDGKTYTKQVHQIVAAAFLGKCPEEHEVNHIDGNRLNNVPENLEYVTRKQNIRHAYNHENYDKYEVVATFSVDTYEDAEYLKAVLKSVFYDLPLVLK